MEFTNAAITEAKVSIFIERHNRGGVDQGFDVGKVGDPLPNDYLAKKYILDGEDPDQYDPDTDASKHVKLWDRIYYEMSEDSECKGILPFLNDDNIYEMYTGLDLEDYPDLKNVFANFETGVLLPVDLALGARNSAPDENGMVHWGAEEDFTEDVEVIHVVYKDKREAVMGCRKIAGFHFVLKEL